MICRSQGSASSGHVSVSLSAIDGRVSVRLLVNEDSSQTSIIRDKEQLVNLIDSAMDYLR